MQAFKLYVGVSNTQSLKACISPPRCCEAQHGEKKLNLSIHPSIHHVVDLFLFKVALRCFKDHTFPGIWTWVNCLGGNAVNRFDPAPIDWHTHTSIHTLMHTHAHLCVSYLCQRGDDISIERRHERKKEGKRHRRWQRLINILQLLVI